MGYDLEPTELLEDCLSSGFEPPLYLIAIGANGSIIVARYAMEDDGLKSTVLTEHLESDGLGAPMNFVIVVTRGPSSRGRSSPKDGAKRLTID
jgi:hypothetical protein